MNPIETSADRVERSGIRAAACANTLQALLDVYCMRSKICSGGASTTEYEQAQDILESKVDSLRKDFTDIFIQEEVMPSNCLSELAQSDFNSDGTEEQLMQVVKTVCKDEKKEKEVIYMSRWLKTYRARHFAKMQKVLAQCHPLLQTLYMGIATAIESQFDGNLSKYKSGRKEIISTYMPREVFQLWTSFQFFANSAIPFQAELSKNAKHACWKQTINLTFDNVPVFASKNYFQLEFKLIQNGVPHFYRIFVTRMDITYLLEPQVFKIKATLMKEQYSIFANKWNRVF